MNKIIRVNVNSVRLCCNGSGCPTVTDIGGGMVQITDDDGNIVKVKREEAVLISDGVKQLTGQVLILE